MSENSKRESRWQIPTDEDWVSAPLVIGLAVAVLAIIASFVFLGWIGLVVLVVVLVVGLLISLRVVTGSETDD